ncbi:ribosomal protein L22 [Thermocrinis albus DSM 14484]|uniref:Large ribosomal subunit protein uL22 n=1 Tax=Thermocrinis albus (strain DSM 14484 / JCM 11386 / HI 11/12) TaxID=638303 RepID=D3SQ10_THEAH|nr:50S ribosomal protein L22 [Thermocrinis albus]ADC89247.1 ribosomal protein L22 [Thermocrinis albus DSM 14484]
MEARAILRYARISPLKARQVLRLIQGKRAADALYQLEFMPKKAAKIVANVLRSAIANADQKKMDLEKLYIKKAVADQGPMYKKWMPRAHGRATMIRKRTSHITIILEEREEEK